MIEFQMFTQKWLGYSWDLWMFMPLKIKTGKLFRYFLDANMGVRELNLVLKSWDW